jgi:hypothetical protein
MVPDEITKFFKSIINNAPIFSALLGLLTILLGYRLVFEKEKRNELNTISEELFTKLTKERSNITPMGGGVSRIEFDKLNRRLCVFNRFRFQKYVKAYYQTKNDNYKRSETGAPYYQDTTSIKEAIDKLLKFLK